MIQIIFLFLVSIFNIPNSNGAVNDCGCADVQEANRIVGGWLAKEYQVPYQAILNVNPGNGRISMCGGTILNRRYILTAAHCIAQNKNPYSPTYVRIFVGFTNRCQHHNNLWEKGLHVEKIIVHPAFENPKNHNDIGLVKLKTGLDFTNKIKPACLPSDLQKKYEDLKGFATGWGMGHRSHYQCKLKATMLTIQKNGVNGQCGSQVANHMMCGFGGRATGVCSGDSGGPMTVTENGKHVVVGVASAVIGGCASGVYPDIFMRVTSFMPWIRETIKDGDCGEDKIVSYDENVIGI